MVGMAGSDGGWGKRWVLVDCRGEEGSRVRVDVSSMLEQHSDHIVRYFITWWRDNSNGNECVYFIINNI